MSAKKKTTRSTSTLNIVLVVQLIIMLGLSIFITVEISKQTRKNANDHMRAITDERTHIIESFVENAEKTLTYFSKSKEVVDMFLDPTNADLQAKAQKLTESFGAEIDYCEGLWCGSVDTVIMTHSKNPDSVGKQTRPDETARNALINPMLLAGNNVYNIGIMNSPVGEHRQILSLYKMIYDKGKAIGFVGLGIYTEGLVETLNNITVPAGIESSFYTMVNIKDGKYIFNSHDTSLVSKEAESDDVKTLCEKYTNSAQSETGDYEYDMNDNEYVSVYTYMPKYGWVLTIDDETSEVYALTRTMIMYLSIFAFIILCLTVVFYFITKRQEKINQKLVSTIAKANLTKKSLNTAMFKDVLTGASNRISLSMDMEKIDQSAEEPYYFTMFNICNFSDINLEYGNEAGDRLLVRAVNDLKDYFEEDTIYRTGSDEFVVSLKTENGLPFADDFLDKVNNAFRQMLVPERLDDGRTIYPKYKVAVIKKTKGIDTSVVTTLKDMTNKKGEAAYGMIDYKDMTV